LKHGLYAAPENERRTMLALGEDPEQFEDLKLELRASFGPGDPLWERQIDDLARLYWRRERLQRAQAGLMRRARLEVEERQHRRQQEIAGAAFDPCQFEAIDIEMVEPSDPAARLRLLLSFLGVIREQVKQRIFKPLQASEIECLYGDNEGWRQVRLLHLLRLFINSPQPKTQGKEESEALARKENGPQELAGEAQYQELLHLLEEEIGSVQEEFEYAEKLNEEKVAVERDACLAPAGEQWKLLLRQEAALDRSIDRKVRILLALRKDYTILLDTPPGEDDGGSLKDIDSVLESDMMSYHLQGVEAPGNSKSKERRGNVHENKGRALGDPGQSGNVIENKGSYSHSAGMLLTTKGVIASTESPDRQVTEWSARV
jgi:hypothetical protein